MFNLENGQLVQPPIGNGSNGEVFLYQDNSQGSKKWVVKRTKPKEIQELFACLSEVVLGFSCDHPCIVPIKGFSIQPADENRYFLYMKLPMMIGGTLGEELRRRKFKELYFNQSELVKHFYSLVCAVDYLHSKKIFHGDIKINNILLDEKGNVKLSDIDSAKYVADEDIYNPLSKIFGAENYKAPEVIKHERDLEERKLFPKDDKSNISMQNALTKEHLYLTDSWSLGLTMLEMCTLVPELNDHYDAAQAIEERLQKIRKEVDSRYQKNLLDIIFGLVKTDPAQRLKVSEAKAKLEENFRQILAEDLKVSLGLEKPQKQEVADILNHLKMFNERTEKIMEVFEDDEFIRTLKQENILALEKLAKESDQSIKSLQKKLETLKVGTQKNQEIEEICKKYDESVQTLKQENLAILERFEKEPDQKSSLNLC